MRFKKYFSSTNYEKIITNLIKENRSLMDCELRMGSKSWCELINEARILSNNKTIIFSKDDLFLLSTDLGKIGTIDSKDLSEETAMAKDKEVELDSPKRTPDGDSKKFMVYVDSGKKDKDGKVKALLVKWGDPNMSVKNHDDKARKSFLARHRCHLKTDRKTAGWWACNVHKYAKQLGLQSSKPW